MDDKTTATNGDPAVLKKGSVTPIGLTGEYVIVEVCLITE